MTFDFRKLETSMGTVFPSVQFDCDIDSLGRMEVDLQIQPITDLALLLPPRYSILDRQRTKKNIQLRKQEKKENP